MDIKKRFLLFLFLIEIVASCCWDAAVGYEKNLEMPVKTNLNKVFKIEDTLWIQINNNTSFYDLLQKQSVNFKDGKFDIGIWFNQVDFTLKKLQDANNNFVCFTHSTIVSQRLPITYQANQYTIKVGLVAKKAGVFVLNLMCFENSPIKKHSCDNYSYRAAVSIKYLDKDITLEKIKTQNLNFSLSDYGFNRFDETRLFFFEVIP